MMNMKIMTRNVLHPLWNYHAMVPALFLFAVLMLSACSSGNGLIGAKNAPDEFEVVIRPPLTLPPNFTLRPNDDNDAASANLANTQAGVSAIGQSQITAPMRPHSKNCLAQIRSYRISAILLTKKRWVFSLTDACRLNRFLVASQK
jgi:uncharacterized lipoprotein